MCIDGPGVRPHELNSNKDQVCKVLVNGQAIKAQIIEEIEPRLEMVLEKSNISGPSQDQILLNTSQIPVTQLSPSIRKKKWKRVAREKQSKLAIRMMASPLQRKLVGNMTAKKTVRRRSLSSSHRVSSPKNSDGRGKLKTEYDTLESPIFSSNRGRRGGRGSKRFWSQLEFENKVVTIKFVRILWISRWATR
ncbi:hypothetical protein LWI29_024250 [Acer saccharum]|uniref:Uncharacterized protein n=1 Tax=Acer saccharum TaxID=4024 RepID=A0AA39VVQ4_ACESA|nr:hypothetical protein LWI29_024250 [Acer saccharum]